MRAEQERQVCYKLTVAVMKMQVFNTNDDNYPGHQKQCSGLQGLGKNCQFWPGKIFKFNLIDSLHLSFSPDACHILVGIFKSS